MALLNAIVGYVTAHPELVTTPLAVLWINLAESVAHDDAAQLLQALAICVDFLSSEDIHDSSMDAAITLAAKAIKASREAELVRWMPH